MRVHLTFRSGATQVVDCDSYAATYDPDDSSRLTGLTFQQPPGTVFQVDHLDANQVVLVVAEVLNDPRLTPPVDDRPPLEPVMPTPRGEVAGPYGDRVPPIEA